jgi:hypothetical protein
MTPSAETFLDYGDLSFRNESDVADERKKLKRVEVSIADMFELDQYSSVETYND